MRLRSILEALVRGEMEVEEAVRRIRLLAIEELEDIARLDVGRELRRGVPEIVLGEGKSREELAEIASRMLSSCERVLISRVSECDASYVVEKAKPHKHRYERLARILALYSEDYKPSRTGGRVAVMSGGTADVRVAEEVRVIVEEMGCDVRTFYDVGIAALQRTLKAVREAMEWGADIIVVVAGREAALASLVAGLVDVPVLGVPVSVGYGFAARGVSALAAMLQSCPLGLAVVNIDAGVAAGVFAAMVANRIASARRADKS